MGALDRRDAAVASLTLGVVSLVLALVPPLGIASAIVAVALGGNGLESTKRGAAVAGVTLGLVALALSVLVAALLVYLKLARHWPF
jgi:hypothetical protein